MSARWGFERVNHTSEAKFSVNCLNRDRYVEEGTLVKEIVNITAQLRLQNYSKTYS